LVFILVLSTLVLIHELGHFLAARKVGIRVEEFGVGLPPRIFGKKIGQTIYSINWLPFGGFVRMYGEESARGLDKKKEAFVSKSKMERLFVVSAGVLMNFLLGLVIFSVTYFFTGIPRDTGKVKVMEVTAGSPAQEVGLQTGDIIKKVDETWINSDKEFVDYVGLKKGKEVSVLVERKGENETVSELNFTLTPRENPPANEGPLGVVISSVEIYYPPIWQRPFYNIYYGLKETFFWSKSILDSFFLMVINLFKGVLPKDISGPVGIFVITSEAAKMGVYALFNFVGILSINLAVLNLIPFPALDGGRLFFVLVELISGKKVPEKFEAAVDTIGMAFLILLLLVVTAFDIQRLVSSGGVAGFIQSFSK